MSKKTAALMRVASTTLVAILTVGIVLPAGNAYALEAVTVDYQNPTSSAAAFKVSETYEQHGAEYASDTVKQRTQDIARQSLSQQNRHVIAFGTTNLWTDPNNRDPASWNWGNLDAKLEQMQLARANGGPEISLVLGMAPNWMTTQNGLVDYDGTQVHSAYEDFSAYPDRDGDSVSGEKYDDNPATGADIITNAEISAAPDPWFEDDFAFMAEQVVQRFTDIDKFYVWNEFKGYYDPSANRWDVAGYTSMYNKVWDAVKAVRPDTKLGGPYIVMDTWTEAEPGSNPTLRPECRGDWGILDDRVVGHSNADPDQAGAIGYWLEHKHGADFLVVDFSTAANKADNPSFDEFHIRDRMQDMVTCVRTIKDSGGNLFSDAQNLPIDIAEFYPSAKVRDGNETRYAAVTANALGEAMNAGFRVAQLWPLQSGSCDGTTGSGLLALWTSTVYSQCNPEASQGQPTGLVPILTEMKDRFAQADTARLTADYDSTTLGVFATNNGSMLVSKTATAQQVSINGCAPLDLSAYEVTFTDPADCRSGQDSDGDGISNGMEDGDANGDSTPDANQASLAVFANTKTGGQNALFASGDCDQLSQVSLDTDAQPELPAEQTNLTGQLSFQAACASPGQSGTFTYYLDKEYDAETLRVYKVGPARDITEAVSFSTAELNGTPVTTLTYIVTDGGSLDQDGSVNGTIADPLVVSTSSDNTTGGAESASTYTVALANTGMSVYALAIVGTGLVAASASGLLYRRKQTRLR